MGGDRSLSGAASLGPDRSCRHTAASLRWCALSSSASTSPGALVGGVSSASPGSSGSCPDCTPKAGEPAEAPPSGPCCRRSSSSWKARQLRSAVSCRSCSKASEPSSALFPDIFLAVCRGAGSKRVTLWYRTLGTDAPAKAARRRGAACGQLWRWSPARPLIDAVDFGGALDTYIRAAAATDEALHRDR